MDRQHFEEILFVPKRIITEIIKYDPNKTVRKLQDQSSGVIAEQIVSGNGVQFLDQHFAINSQPRNS